MRSKTPFEMSKKQKKNIEMLKSGLRSFEPLSATKVHTGDNWKARKRREISNPYNAFGKPFDVANYFNKKVLT